MNASFRVLTCLLVGLSCFIGGSASAQPPKKGGGGSGDGGSTNNGGGVIYFTHSATIQGSQLYQMNDDGSGVTALPIPTSQLGSPSYQLHAGYRWFLIESMYLNDDYYTVIVNVAGDVVPLFSNSGEISVTGGRQWTRDDRYVSLPGRRVDMDQTSPTFGQWIDFGLYMVEILYDEDGFPLGTLGQPAFVLPSPAVYYNNQSQPQSDIRFHSWSDHGLRFVYARYVHTDRLSVGNLLTQQTTDIGVDPAAWYGGTVSWAPDAERVMCNYTKSKSMVITMNIDGSGLAEIAGSTSTVTVFAGDWSPTGSHLAYKHQDGWGKDSRITRATNTGGSKTRITGKSQFGSGPSGPTVLGWRATN